MQRQIVYFVDDPVDVISQSRALRLDGLVVRDHLFGAVAQFGQWVRLKAKAVQPFDGAGLRVRQGIRQGPPGICKELERTRAGDLRIQLPQRPSSGVARVGKGLSAGFCLAVVQSLKIRMRHVDLAADLQHLRRPFDVLWHIRDSAGICGDVFTRFTIATRGRLNQFAVLISQG